jgi:hypothetical protein
MTNLKTELVLTSIPPTLKFGWPLGAASTTLVVLDHRHYLFQLSIKETCTKIAKPCPSLSVSIFYKRPLIRQSALPLLSTLIRKRFQVKPATLLIPLIFISIFRWRSFIVPGTKVAPFPYLIWGVIFHCLRSSFFFFFSFETLNTTFKSI